MKVGRISYLAGAVVAVAATTGASLAMTEVSSAATKGPVSAYIFALRRINKTVLVAYRAHNNTSVAQLKASCTVFWKPTYKITSPPYYFAFSPTQKFSLPKATSKFTYIGAFSLPKTPTTIRLKKVWVHCK